MKTRLHPWVAAALAAVALSALASASHAQTYTEGEYDPASTDAGQTLGTAQSTASSAATAGGGLTEIVGSIFQDSDADLYAITITSPGTFSATTNNAATNAGQTAGSDDPGAALNTELFLFDSSGHAIAANDDDASGTTVTSTLPAGNSLYANLAAGTYYLGVSISMDDPVNSVDQLLFATDPQGGTTSVRGPNATANPDTLSDFDPQNVNDEFGNYEIDLAGAGTAFLVPEPSTWAALLFCGGLIAAGGIARRRRTARV